MTCNVQASQPVGHDEEDSGLLEGERSNVDRGTHLLRTEVLLEHRLPSLAEEVLHHKVAVVGLLGQLEEDHVQMSPRRLVVRERHQNLCAFIRERGEIASRADA